MPEPKQPTPDAPPYVDRSEIVETFADQVRMTHFDGHNLRIEFAIARPQVAATNTVSQTIFPCARIVLPPMTAVVLFDQLKEVLNGLEKAGVLKRIAPSSDTKQ